MDALEDDICILALEFVEIAGRFVHGMDYWRLSGITVVNRFVGHFGVTPRHCAFLWLLCEEKTLLIDPYREKKHLLWCLNALKCDETEHVLHGRWRADEKTIRKWLFVFLEALSDLGVVSINELCRPGSFETILTCHRLTGSSERMAQAR